MVLKAICCKHCGEAKLVKRHGTSKAGKQRYRCFGCQKTFLLDYTNKAYDPQVQAQITTLAFNGCGVRDTARVLGIHRDTVSAHFKKK